MFASTSDQPEGEQDEDDSEDNGAIEQGVDLYDDAGNPRPLDEVQAEIRRAEERRREGFPVTVDDLTADARRPKADPSRLRKQTAEGFKEELSAEQGNDGIEDDNDAKGETVLKLLPHPGNPTAEEICQHRAMGHVQYAAGAAAV